MWWYSVEECVFIILHFIYHLVCCFLTFVHYNFQYVGSGSTILVSVMTVWRHQLIGFIDSKEIELSISHFESHGFFFNTVGLSQLLVFHLNNLALENFMLKLFRNRVSLVKNVQLLKDDASSSILKVVLINFELESCSLLIGSLFQQLNFFILLFIVLLLGRSS